MYEAGDRYITYIDKRGQLKKRIEVATTCGPAVKPNRLTCLTI